MLALLSGQLLGGQVTTATATAHIHAHTSDRLSGPINVAQGSYSGRLVGSRWKTFDRRGLSIEAVNIDKSAADQHRPEFVGCAAHLTPPGLT